MYYPQLETANKEIFNTSYQYSMKQESMSCDLDEISVSELELFKEDFLTADNTSQNYYSSNTQFDDILNELSIDNEMYDQPQPQPQPPMYPSYTSAPSNIYCSFQSPSSCSQCQISQAPTSTYPNFTSSVSWPTYSNTQPTAIPYSNIAHTVDRRSYSISSESCPSYTDQTVPSSYPPSRGLYSAGTINEPYAYSQFGSQECSASYQTSSTPSPANNNSWEHWSYSSGQSSPINLEAWSPQPVVNISSLMSEASLQNGLEVSAVNKKGSTRKRKERKLQLWEFILDLLNNDPLNDAVEWMDKLQGLFRIVSQESLVRRWSTYRNRGHMTFEKLTRTLRFYYPKGFLTKIHGKHNLYKYHYNRLPKPSIL